jgi:hypothetical protein
MSEETGFAPIPAVTEPRKVLGPPIDVVVLRTSDNHVDAHNHHKFGLLYRHHIAQERITHHAYITHIAGVWK